jgi:hypothetical protein
VPRPIRGIKEGIMSVLRAQRPVQMPRPMSLLVFFGLILIFKINPVAFAEVSVESTVNEPSDEGKNELLSRAAEGLSDEVLDRLLNPSTRMEAAMELLTSGTGFNLWRVKTLIRILSRDCRRSLLSGEEVRANSREIDLSGG